MNKLLSGLLVLGVSANVFLVWKLHDRIPPLTVDLDDDLTALSAPFPSIDSDDLQVKAEVALGQAIRAGTHEMLEQRRLAALRFIDMRYTVDARDVPPADAERIASLEADITAQAEAVRAAAAAVDEVRGGTIRTQRLVTLAMAQTTLAMMQRHHLAVKHGIALPTASVPMVPAAVKGATVEIEADIAERRRNVQDARDEADRYAGGLIKLTLLSRLATEQETLAALEQRHMVLKHGLPSPPGLVPAAVTTVPPEALAGIEADIAATRDSIASGEREASRYSGGLIYVTILSRLATERTTMAMLEQRRLAIKHGLLMVPPSTAADLAPNEPPGTIVNDKDAL